MIVFHKEIYKGKDLSFSFCWWAIWESEFLDLVCSLSKRKGKDINLKTDV